MMRHDEQGALAGISISLVTLTFVAISFTFLSYLKIVLSERADLELQQEIDSAMRMVDADAMEASICKVYVVEGNSRIAFRKERADESAVGRTRSEASAVTYALITKNGPPKFCRIRSTVPQPLTGESMFGAVTIVTFQAEELPSGGIHVVLEGRSQRTGHTYRQTAIYPLRQKS